MIFITDKCCTSGRPQPKLKISRVYLTRFYSHLGILWDKCRSGGGFVLPSWGKNSLDLVVTGQTADTALNQDKTELWIPVLADLSKCLTTLLNIDDPRFDLTLAFVVSREMPGRAQPCCSSSHPAVANIQSKLFCSLNLDSASLLKSMQAIKSSPA